MAVPTLYASFVDAELAEKAAGALLDHGARPDDISIVANESYHSQRRTVATDPVAAGADPAFSEMIVVDERDEYRENVEDAEHSEEAAKAGISTTTSGDAASGAAKGAGIGLGIGVLAALAAMAIPGVGLVIGGGALATALAGAAGATVAGAAAGAVTGYLKDQGVPEHVAERYTDTFAQGGALLAMSIPSGEVTAERAEAILDKYGATNVATYGGAPV